MTDRRKLIACARVFFVLLGAVLISCSPADQNVKSHGDSEPRAAVVAPDRGMGNQIFEYLGMSEDPGRPDWSAGAHRDVVDNGRSYDDVYGELGYADTTTMTGDAAREYMQGKAMGLAQSRLSGAFSDYFSQRFFSGGARLSPDASVGDRMQHEITALMLANLQRQGASTASQAFDAMLAGSENEDFLETALTELQLGLANDVINRGLDGLRGVPMGAFQNLEGEFIVRKGQAPEYALTTVQPFYESVDLRHTFFGQASLRTQDDDRTGNFGLAYRHMTEDRKYLYGVNSFIDYEWPDRHARMSLGADASTSLLSVNLNRYWPLTGWRDTELGFQERGMAGWDGGVTGRLQNFPDIQLAARGYLWEREGEDGNLQGAEAGFDYSPVPALKLGMRAGRDTDESFTMATMLSFRWLFGMDADRQLRKSEYALDDVSGRRYDKVQRENRILKETRQNPALTARVVATVGANSVQRPDGTTGAVQAGQQLPYGSRITVANTAGAIVELAYGNGATLIIGQDSQVQISATNVALVSGIMRFISGGTDITINIPGGEVFLTGTDIDVRSDGSRTTVRVRDGSIRVEATNGTQTANSGETVVVDLGSPSSIPFADPEAELHRNEAHLKLDRAGASIETQAAAAPYVTAAPAVANFAGASFDVVVPFSKPVSVTGTPVLSFTINGASRTATYSGGSGTVALSFTHTTVAADIGQSNFVMDILGPEQSIVASADSGQFATLTVLPETIALPGPITGGGGGTPPDVLSITPDGVTTADSPIAFTVTFSEAVSGFDAVDPVVMGGSVVSVVAVTPAQYTVNVTPAADGAVSIMIPAGSATDTDGLGNTASATATVTSDRTAPAGYAVAFDVAAVTSANAAAVSLDITGAEMGATLAYSISSSGGGAPLTGSVTVTAASQTIGPLDLGGLPDGTLTASVTLTDTVGNAGAAATGTVTKTTAGAAATAMTGPAARNYAAGANLDFTVTFATPVTGTGTPRLVLDMNGTPVYATYISGGGTATLTFRHTVLAGSNATPLDFAATAIDLNGGTLTEVGSGNAVDLDFTSVAPDLSGVFVDTLAPSGYAVSFDAPVNGVNAAAAGLTMTGLEPGGAYALTVTSDAGGAPVNDAGAITAATMPVTLDLSGLNDGTLTATLTATDAAGNAGAAVTGSSPKSTTAPTAVVNTAAALTNASPIVFTITFSEPVTGLTASDLTVVNGTAAAPTTGDNITWQTNVTPVADGVVSVQVQAGAVTNGGGTPNLVSNTATTTSDRTAPAGQAVAFVSPLINSANVAAVDVNLTGLELPATYSLSISSSGGGTPYTESGSTTAATMPRSLNLSTLNDGNVTAVLVVTDAAGNIAVAVNATATKTTAAPAITAATAPANGYYNAGDILNFTVTWNQSVTVTGTPRLALNMNGTTVYADHVAGAPGATQAFRVTVAAPQTAAPLAFAATTIDLNGGTIAATASGNAAALNFNAVAPVLASIFIDTTAPVLNAIAPPGDRVYVTGEAISFSVTFSEIMAVTGTPRLELTYGSTTSYATYASGAGSTTLIFSYVAQASDLAPAGLVVANALDLNGGNLADQAGNMPASLAFTAPDLTGVQINVPSCAGGTVDLGAPFLNGFCAGRVTIAGSNFDLIVAPAGCGYEPSGTATTAPNSYFTPACSGTDSTTKTWSDATGTLEGGASVEDGITNTVNLLNETTRENPAVSYCYRLDVNGRTDWYLPSRNELDTLRQNLGQFGLLGFAGTTYWSSTETDANSANIYDMTGGLSAVSKTASHTVRCVRRITPPQIALNPNPADGREGVAYTATIAATGGGGSLTFTLVSGTLPPGLTLNPSTGVITGTPTVAGVYPGLVIRASDAFGQSETNPFTITVTGLPRCNNGTVVTGTAYGGGLCAANVTIGAQNYDLVVTPANCGQEPAGSTSSKPGAPFTPTCTGTVDGTSKRWSNSTSFNDGGASTTDGIGNTLQQRHDDQSQNAASAYCYHMEYGGFDDWYLPSRDEVTALYTNMSMNNVGGLAAAAYQTSTQVSTSQNTVIDLSNGVVSSQNKTSSVRLRCVRRVGSALRIVQPAALPGGAENIAYSQTFTASSSAGGITFSLAGGTLPPGLALNAATGALTGIPTAPGTYPGIIIRATDATSATADTPALSITITGLPRCAGNTVLAGAAYGGGICAGEMGGYDLVATNPGCGYETGGNNTSKPANEFTNACGGTVDTITKPWSNATGTNEVASSTTNGLTNTQYLVGDGRRVNAAAGYCYHLTTGGFSDWYLPSQDELTALYSNLHANGLGGFSASTYNSSTQNSTTQNRARSFVTGAVNNSNSKTSSNALRCVRRHNPGVALTMQTTVIPATASQNIAYRMRIPASSSLGPVTFAVVSGTLPTGLTLNTATGIISGSPTVAGTTTGIVVSATDGTTTQQTAPFDIVVEAVDACDGGAVPSGSAFGGGLCAGTVTIASETYDLVVTQSNCAQESGGSDSTKPVTNFTPTCSGATDSVTKRWTTVGAGLSEAASTTDGIGNTLQLTTDARRDNPAAGYCESLVVGGFDDWYLPSQAELVEVNAKLFAKGLGGFAATNYWASTESSAANAVILNAVNGTVGNTAKNSTSSVPRVRCVRRTDSPLRIAASPVGIEAYESLAFSYFIRAQGGTGARTFTLTGGSLPAGLSLNSATGEISGTPTTPGTAAGLVVSVSDGSTTQSTAAFHIVVNTRARCVGGILAGDTAHGGLCAGTVSFGAGLPYDLIVAPSGCGVEPSGTTTSKPSTTFTPTCSGTDAMSKRWGSTTTANENATSVDDGVANTLQLLSDGQSANAAAAYCFHLSVNGFDDWYLPSEQELNAVYQNMARWRIGGFNYGISTLYWSSTESSAANARRQVFDKLGTVGNTNKTTTTNTRVRCVRRN